MKGRFASTLFILQTVGVIFVNAGLNVGEMSHAAESSLSPFSASANLMLVTRSGSSAQRLSDLIYHQSRSRHSSSQKMRTHPKYNSRTTRQSPSRLLAQTTCSSACTAPGPRSTFFRRAFPPPPPACRPLISISQTHGPAAAIQRVDIAISGKVPDTAPASVRARRRVCTS